MFNHRYIYYKQISGNSSSPREKLSGSEISSEESKEAAKESLAGLMASLDSSQLKLGKNGLFEGPYADSSRNDPDSPFRRPEPKTVKEEVAEEEGKIEKRSDV